MLASAAIMKTEANCGAGVAMPPKSAISIEPRRFSMYPASTKQRSGGYAVRHHLINSAVDTQ